MSIVEESLSGLGNSKVFSKLDANSGFWQVRLTEESKKLTTFLSSLGRFCFNRLQFGISSAPEIFSRLMSQVLAGIPGVICHMDDILVHGPDVSTHDQSLHQVLSRLQKSGLTLNQEKCVFHKNSLTFLGFHIDGSGVKPDARKIKAIQTFPSPTNRTELRRLNGMLNQLARFVPHLATINAPMRELLKEGREWMWGLEQEKAFSRIKDVLTSAETMAHYDLSLPTILATDASNVGLGAALFQVQKDGTRRPVTYVSRSLTDTEKNYAAIEKEALGVTWGCERLDQFIRGMAFTVETDHKLLVPLMTIKDLSQIPARILRMRLRMMRYSPSFQHVPGTQNQLADALSRAPCEQPSDKEIVFVDELESSATNLFPKNSQLEEIRTEQKRDEVLREVIRYCELGWPAYKSDANLAIQPYWDAQAHLTMTNDLLLYNDKIIIPCSLRLKTLDQIHQAHQGITKCRARARKSVWWPRMSTQIQEMVQGCRECRIASPTPTKPLCPSTPPERAWERLGMDLFLSSRRSTFFCW